MNSNTDSSGNAAEHSKNYVKIEINDTPYDIHRGNQTVKAIKEKGKVPLNHMLEQQIDGRLKPLDDEGRVVIKGGEIFISHPRDGGSS